MTCGVIIEESGAARDEISPSDVEPAALLRLLVCYTVKIRWVLESEPPALVGGLQELLGDVVGHLPIPVEDGFLDSVSTVAHLRADSTGDWAEPGGETFVVRLFMNPTPHVTNDLAMGRAFNVPWHLLLLIEAVRKKLDQHQREALQAALDAIWDDLFVEPIDSSFRGLRQLTEVANNNLDTILNP